MPIINKGIDIFKEEIKFIISGISLIPTQIKNIMYIRLQVRYNGIVFLYNYLYILDYFFLFLKRSTL